MFHLLTLATRIFLLPHNVTDKESCRSFLLDFTSLVKSYAESTKTTLDDTLLKHIEFLLKNNVLFDYAYSVIFEQLQTEEILFESAEEETIIQLVENAVVKETESPEAIDPVVIFSIIARIVDLINAIKNK